MQNPHPFKPVLVPISKITEMGSICAWAGCPRKFKGTMPSGWTWLQVYWSPHVICEPLDRNWTRDGVLCPEHTLKLDAQMKRIPRVAE